MSQFRTTSLIILFTVTSVAGLYYNFQIHEIRKGFIQVEEYSYSQARKDYLTYQLLEKGEVKLAMQNLLDSADSTLKHLEDCGILQDCSDDQQKKFEDLMQIRKKFVRDDLKREAQKKEKHDSIVEKTLENLREL